MLPLLTIPFAIAFLATLALTPVVARLAQRFGHVAKPTHDRWHQLPTALMGGVAIFSGFFVAAIVAVLLANSGRVPRPNLVIETGVLGILLSATIMFIAGVADDIVKFRPATKLVLQLIAAATLLTSGVVFPLTPWVWINMPFTFFWFLGVTNALNLLDNMDGVAVGVGGIAALFLAVTFAINERWLLAATCLALAGATAGFLPYNFHRASIFMGDSGSLFIGALLAGLGAAFPSRAPGSVVSVLFVPALIVIIPIADTTLVTITRTLAGRSVTVGGRDHTTHRLVAMGLSEPQVALLLYAFAIAGGLLAISLQQVNLGYSLWVGALFLVMMFTAAAYLSKFHTYPAAQVAGSPRFTVVVSNLLYKGRALEVMLDLLLFTLAYYGGLLLRWEGSPPPTQAIVLQETLGVFVAGHLAAFSAVGVYRGVWRAASLADVIRVAKGVAAGSVLTAAALAFVFRENEFSRSVLIISSLLAAILAIGMRVSFRLIDWYRQGIRGSAPPIAIYGAGVGGELFLRELRAHERVTYDPVAFIDDDPAKLGLLIQGVPVIGSRERIIEFARTQRLAAIVVSMAEVRSDTLESLRATCDDIGIELLRFRTTLEPVLFPRDVQASVRRIGGVN